jgi:hypothetical protein
VAGCHNTVGRVCTSTGPGLSASASAARQETERAERARRWADQRERIWRGFSDGVGRMVDTTATAAQGVVWTAENLLTGSVSAPFVSPEMLQRGMGHMNQHPRDSNWVSSSQTTEIAANGKFTGVEGRVYMINNGAGVDVNATLGDLSTFPKELEVAFPHGIPGSDIVGSFPTMNGLVSGPFDFNPFYTGPAAQLPLPLPPPPFR